MGKMRDSYKRFFSEGHITKEQFFDFGLKETIYASKTKAGEEWKRLKKNIRSNGEVFIRGFGRDAKGTHLFLEFYKKLLDNDNIKKDPTNNNEPRKLIKDLTGYSKSGGGKDKLIRNYQISHIFGRTKNVYAFTAPWNIAYIPKLVDPLTGHEAQGTMVDEYTKLYQKQAYKLFKNLIDDFNLIITDSKFVKKMEDSINKMQGSSNDIEKLRKAVREDFSPIEV
jgi:hypothetical protein